MNSTPCCTQTHTHKHMPACMLMCYCSRFRATPDESALRPCTLPSNFTHMPAATPVGCVSVMPLCSTFYVYFTHGWRQQLQKALACAGLVWLQCDHRVLTATHEFWCNPRRHCCKVSRHRLYMACHASLHTCLLHTLCCCKLVLAVAWVQGSQQTAAHTECGAILIQQYQGVQHTAHALCGAKVMLYSPRKATASAAASLCSLVCDCYRVLTSPQGCSSRADQHNPAHKG
jgi:hypothetical protein